MSLMWRCGESDEQQIPDVHPRVPTESLITVDTERESMASMTTNLLSSTCGHILERGGGGRRGTRKGAGPCGHMGVEKVVKISKHGA